MSIACYLLFIKKSTNKCVKRTHKNPWYVEWWHSVILQWFQHSTLWFENRWKEESAFSFNIKKPHNSFYMKQNGMKKTRYKNHFVCIEFNISGANRTQLYKSNRIPQYFHSRIIEKAAIKRSTIIINLKSLQHLIFISMFDARCLFISHLFRFDLNWERADLLSLEMNAIERSISWARCPFFSSLSLFLFIFKCLSFSLWFYSEWSKWKLMAHHSIESNYCKAKSH